MSKVHLPHPSALGGPLCGRQVFNHRQRVSQDQDGVVIAMTQDEFSKALHALRPKACRFCARVAGFLPPLEHKARDTNGAYKPTEDDQLNDDAEEGESDE